MITSSFVEKAIKAAKQSLVEEFEAELRKASETIIREKVATFSQGVVTLVRSMDQNLLQLHIRFDEPEERKK